MSDIDNEQEAMRETREKILEKDDVRLFTHSISISFSEICWYIRASATITES